MNYNNTLVTVTEPKEMQSVDWKLLLNRLERPRSHVGPVQLFWLNL